MATRMWMVAVAVVLLATAARAEEMKFGYVDLQKALNDSDAGKKAKEDFKKQADKMQADLKKQRDEIDSLKAELDKKALVMKEEERRNLQSQYEKKLRDFERNLKDSQGELQNKDNELTGDILRGLHEVIQELGKKEKYTLILESSGTPVLFVAPEADLTDEILKLYNQRKK